jgi:hypothetical protein
MENKFIGEKQVKFVSKTEEKTETGAEIIKVEYEDGTLEHFSKLMFEKIVSDEKCDLTKLRDKRLTPVVELVLTILRDWGVKIGELPYFAALINQSLQYNSDQALIKLISEYMPKPQSLDDVDYITIDRILRNGKSE